MGDKTGQAALVGCGIFMEETRAVLARHPEIEASLHWIGAGLHVDLEGLERELETALAGSRGKKLLIGYACLPDMRPLAERHGATLLSAKNCLEAFLGADTLAELEKDRGTVITAAWLRQIFLPKEEERSLLNWDPVELRIGMGRYDRIIVLDFGLAPLSDEEILEAFDAIQVPLELRESSLEEFEERLLALIRG